MSDLCPYLVLELAPTRDLGVIKRAYFKALKKHPPHVDPDAFRRIRAAYERLSRQDERAYLYLTATIHPDVELRDFEARFGERLAQIQAELLGEARREELTARFLATVTWARFEDLKRSADAANRGDPCVSSLAR